jgi:excisionase family DNA binding protein
MDRQQRKILTPEQVCQRYGFTMSTLYQYTSQKIIPHLKIRGFLRFIEQELEEWERSKTVPMNTKLL